VPSAATAQKSDNSGDQQTKSHSRADGDVRDVHVIPSGLVMI
jgi:hypothetical protein